MKNKGVIQFLFFFIPAVIFLSLAAYLVFVSGPRHVKDLIALNRRFYNTFNYSFSGTVMDYQQYNIARGERFGVITLSLTFSDISQYDPSDTSSLYFCKIKNGIVKALIPPQLELARSRNLSNGFAVQVGDSISFDGERDRFIIYLSNDTISCGAISLMLDEDERRRVASYLN